VSARCWSVIIITTFGCFVIRLPDSTDFVRNTSNSTLSESSAAAEYLKKLPPEQHFATARNQIAAVAMPLKVNRVVGLAQSLYPLRWAVAIIVVFNHVPEFNTRDERFNLTQKKNLNLNRSCR